MQLIAEAYDVLHRGLGLSHAGSGRRVRRVEPRAARVVPRRAHRAGLPRSSIRRPAQPLVDVIQDKAGQKGTGKWTAQIALDLAVAIPTIAAALDARVLSSLKDAARRREPGRSPRPTRARRSPAPIATGWQNDAARRALRRARLQLRAGHGAHRRRRRRNTSGTIDLAEMARIWKGGCIIRARLLDPVRQAFAADPALANLLVDPAIARELQTRRARLAPRRRRRGVGRDCRSRRSAPASPTSTATAPRGCRRTSRRRSATRSARTPTSGSRSPGFVHADWGLQASDDMATLNLASVLEHPRA